MVFPPWLLLISAWIFFGLLHSLLAAAFVKQLAMRKMNGFYKYYRFMYSLFATALLVLVLYYHFSCPALLLWQSPLPEKIIAILFIIAGAGIVVACIGKYFFDLSGIDAIRGKIKPLVLQQTGMHAYVRHPLYFGTLLFVWALFFLYPFLNNGISCICISLYTLVGIYFEEKKLVNEYGEAYQKYQARVPGLLPTGFWKK